MHSNKEPGLRSQLLKEVRQERQHCFAVAEAAARQRSALNCSATELSESLPSTPTHLMVDGIEYHADMQNQIVNQSVPATRNPASVPGHGAIGWDAKDDIAQADALRALRFLGEQSRQKSELESKLAGTYTHQAANKDELSSLQIQLASLKESLAKEREQRQSMQHQMMCLEQELDAKEATINDLERDLERKDEELSQVGRGQKRAIEGDDARVKALEHQLRDRQQQLQTKDDHIARLLNVLRQHRNKYSDEESTTCSSE